MYIILRRNGWIFASLGCDYIVVNPDGATVVKDMHKLNVERQFRTLSA